MYRGRVICRGRVGRAFCGPHHAMYGGTLAAGAPKPRKLGAHFSAQSMPV